MHRMPEEESVGWSVDVCSLGVLQTCGGREGTKPQRETNRTPGAAKIKTRQRGKSMLLFVCMQMREKAENELMHKKWKNPDSRCERYEDY